MDRGPKPMALAMKRGVFLPRKVRLRYHRTIMFVKERRHIAGPPMLSAGVTRALQSAARVGHVGAHKEESRWPVWYGGPSSRPVSTRFVMISPRSAPRPRANS